jgi:transcriptional regulator with XRE-family HTH domain
MNDESAQQLGGYIRYHRTAQHKTIRTLAEQAAVDSAGLTRLEHGKVHNPRPNTLCSLATALNLPLADLFSMAGYTVPNDLPSIKPYLRTKYSFLPAEEVTAIGNEVEWMAAMYSSKAIHSNKSGSGHRER